MPKKFTVNLNADASNHLVGMIRDINSCAIDKTENTLIKIKNYVISVAQLNDKKDLIPNASQVTLDQVKISIVRLDNGYFLGFNYSFVFAYIGEEK